MSNRRWIAGTAVGALVVAGLIAPALGAPQAPRVVTSRPATAALGAFGGFTPSSADPKLAALLQRSGLDSGDFRFTPAESRRSGNRAVTVAVRARSTVAARQAVLGLPDVLDSATVGLKPIAYNLGVAVGWKRFAVSGDISHIDLGGAPGSRERADVGVTYSGRKFSGRVVATADRPLAGTPNLVADAPSYSIDLGGSYSISKRLDLTAGVRYKSEDYRIDRTLDNRRDSQAVYIGTALRF